MGRLVINTEELRVLPIVVNGKEYDLRFRSNLTTQNRVINILRDIVAYQRRLAEICQKTNVSDTAEIESVLDDFARCTEEGLELCERISINYSTMIEGWKDIAGDNAENVVDIPSLERIAVYMSKEMAKDDLIGKQVKEQLEVER